MKKILSFALGYLTEEINRPKTKKLLDYLKKIGVSGVEITFGPKKRLFSFKLTDDTKRRLKQFDYLTIHAPFELVRESKNNQEIIRQLDIIAKLYSKIEAKNVIIHPDNLPSPKILKKYKFQISTENLKKKRNISTLKLIKIFKEYPGIGFCLDTSHAYSWSKYETKNLINAFKNKITQIHLSASNKNIHHQALRGADKYFLLSIEPIKELAAPIVIEEKIKTVNLKAIKKEIEYIKKKLNFEL